MMKKQWAATLAAASISMVIAVPAMADTNTNHTNHMNDNPVKNSVNRLEKDLGIDGKDNGTTNMNGTRTMNNMNNNMYDGRGTGTGTGTYNTNAYNNGTYGTNNVRANATTDRGNGWGWLGLLGLFGLAGLRKEKHEGTPHHAK